MTKLVNEMSMVLVGPFEITVVGTVTSFSDVLVVVVVVVVG